MGVCEVRDITKLSEDNGKNFDYYVLRSVYDKTKVSYIPVENHKVALRTLISQEKAETEYEKLLEKYQETRDDNDESGRMFDSDPLRIGEIAYVLHRKPEELFPADEEDDNNGK